MLDSGVRIAAAFLPVGVPVLVGLVVAVLRRQVLPGVAGPAIAGLFLQLLAVLASTFLVAEAGLGLFGVGRGSLLTVSSVIGFAVIVLNVLSWTLLLVALFRRLPARSADRTPTGRHALLDEQGEQVIAEEGTTLLPVGAAAAGAGAGVGLGAVAASSATTETPPPAPDAQPWPDDEPAVTETFAVDPPPAGPDADAHPDADRDAGPDVLDADTPDLDLDREEPPAVTAESLDEAAETEDEAHGDVAETDEPDVEPDDESATTATIATPAGADSPHGETVEAADPASVGSTETATVAASGGEDPAYVAAAEEARRGDAPAGSPAPEQDAEDAVDRSADDDVTSEPVLDAEDDAADAADDAADEDAAATTGTIAATPTSTATPEAPGTPPGRHPWFDPDGEAAAGTSPEAETSRAGSAEGR